MTAYTLAELAAFLGASASETPGPTITGVRPLEFARETDITYIVGPQFLERLAKSRAAAVLVPRDVNPGGLPCICCANPEAAFGRLTGLYYPYPDIQKGIAAKADVHPEAALGADVSIGPFAVIDRGAEIGDRTVIGAHAVIGCGCKIGKETRIFPHVTLYPGVSVGDRVIIHAGTVVGSDGFGYARDVDEKGVPVNIKKYHSGTVEIGDDVEIGALVAIDRALAGVTKLGKGVKLDNLVQIAHNVQVGDATVVASQVGIAGSSTIGRYGLIGGQAGVRDHVAVGDGVILATRVGIYRNVPDGSVMAGSVPAMPHKIFLRAQNLFKRLPEILERIRKLERLVQSNHKETS
ncbi:MAG TPA: UDP-3-O-(3-hydroxymyristoyl)glucosamine N-acyltransferase [Desulfomonilaceae bacterium]|nr:UDP-3-O-(3-hydroxymyristoyl)glucosamine N-acyltransferase [Desulfomonilaceae bacterium]